MCGEIESREDELGYFAPGRGSAVLNKNVTKFVICYK
jgi:hypothetical protein